MSRKLQSKSSRLSQKNRPKRGSRRKASKTRKIALATVKDDFSKYLRLAATEEIVITRHGRPAGVLIGFETEEDWFEYQLENHPEFLNRIAAARESLRRGEGMSLEDVVKKAG